MKNKIIVNNINMPLFQGLDSVGQFISYGVKGKRYYYTTPIGQVRALHKAKKQGRAIAISKARAKGHIIVRNKNKNMPYIV